LNEIEANTPIINLMPRVYNRQAESGNSYTTNGITWTTNRDGSITATGTATAAAYYGLDGSSLDATVPVIHLDPTKNYILSGCPSVSTSASNCGMVVRLTPEGTTPSGSSGTTANVYHYSDRRGYKFTGYEYIYIYLVIRKNYNCGDGVTFYPMLEVGEIAHPYLNVHDITMHLN